MGNVGAADTQATPDVLPVRRTVGVGQRLIDQLWWPEDSPVQAALPYDVLHQSEVSVALAKRELEQGCAQMPHEEFVTRMVPRLLRAAMRGHGG